MTRSANIAFFLFLGLILSCGKSVDLTERTDRGTTSRVQKPVLTSHSATDKLLVSITTATEGAKIYYTLDQSTPSKSATLYTGLPIELTKTTTVRCQAFKDGFSDSEIAEEEFKVTPNTPPNKVAAPTFIASPDKTDPAKVDVSVSSSTAGAVIYCTTDGREPTNVLTAYAAPISVSYVSLIRCKAYDSANQLEPSDVAEKLVKQVEPPRFEVDSTTSPPKVIVKILEGEKGFGASLYYTTDKTDPTPASTPYKDPIEVLQTTQIRSRAYKDGWLPSDIAQQDVAVVESKVTTVTATIQVQMLLDGVEKLRITDDDMESIHISGSTPSNVIVKILQPGMPDTQLSWDLQKLKLGLSGIIKGESIQESSLNWTGRGSVGLDATGCVVIDDTKCKTCDTGRELYVLSFDYQYIVSEP